MFLGSHHNSCCSFWEILPVFGRIESYGLGLYFWGSSRRRASVGTWQLSHLGYRDLQHVRRLVGNGLVIVLIPN